MFTTVHCSKDRCSTDNLPHFVDRVKIPTSDDIFMTGCLDRKHIKGKSRNGRSRGSFYLCAVASYLDVRICR